MTMTARLSTALVTVLAAIALCTASFAATAEAAPKSPKPTTLSASQCDTLRVLTREMEKGAEAAYADGDKELGDRLSNDADNLWAEAARGGCRWATWRTNPSAGIDQVNAPAAAR
jgi:hypothetical protein